MGKWLWRIGEQLDSLWRHIIQSKYGVRRDGWDVSRLSHRCSSLWRDIEGIKDTFASQIRYHVGSREDLFFWQDVCVGDIPLAVQFLDLYRCARNRQAKAKDFMESDADRILWGPTPIFRRDLIESEEDNLMSLLDKLS